MLQNIYLSNYTTQITVRSGRIGKTLGRTEGGQIRLIHIRWRGSGAGTALPHLEVADLD